MARVESGSEARRQLVHTETRSSGEVVLARVVSYVFGAIEVLIALRFVLLLLGANAATGFVSFIYGLSSIFMAPFNAVLKTTATSGSMLEWSALVALAIYALLGWGIVKLIYAISPRRGVQTVERVEESQDATTKQ